MTDLDAKFKKNVHKAIEWVAAEHDYFVKLKGDLQILKDALKANKKRFKIQAINKALRDTDYIGYSERQVGKYELQVEEIFGHLKENVKVYGTAKEAEELISQIHTEAAQLVVSSSFYTGKLRGRIKKLKQVLRKGTSEETQEILNEIEQAINDTEKWIAALSSDLQKAKNLSFKELRGMTIEEINEKLKVLEPKSKFSYLLEIMKKK